MAKPEPRQADLTMMYAIHAALRRDLERLLDHARHRMSDPVNRHRSWAGWELFKAQIEHHHHGEDEMIWPPMRERLAGRRDSLDVLDEMEHEHGAIDPATRAVDSAFASGQYEDVADALEDLNTKTVHHLAHEERDAVPLIRETLTAAEMAAVGRKQAKDVGFRGAGQFLAWVLEGATPEHTAGVLSSLPPPVRLVYRRVWHPRFSRTDRWA